MSNLDGGRNRGGLNKSMDVGHINNLLEPVSTTLGRGSVVASGVSGVDSTGGAGAAGRVEPTAEWTGDGDWQTGEYTLASDH